MRAPVARLNREFILRSTAKLDFIFSRLYVLCMYLHRDDVTNFLVFCFAVLLVVCQGNENTNNHNNNPSQKQPTSHEPWFRWPLPPLSMHSMCVSAMDCIRIGPLGSYSGWVSDTCHSQVFCPWARCGHPWKHWRDTQIRGSSCWEVCFCGVVGDLVFMLRWSVCWREANVV